MVEDKLFSGESINVEYKVEVPKKSEKYMKTVVAFANGHGGCIVFGIDDKTRKVVGMNPDTIFRTMDAITNAISDSCEPRIYPDVVFRTMEDKTIIVVEIQPGSMRPYYLKEQGIVDGIYVRVVGTSRHAEGYSKLRNPAIASAFAYMKIIEKWGTGIPRMIRECREYGLPEPKLIDFDGDFRVNMYRMAADTEDNITTQTTQSPTQTTQSPTQTTQTSDQALIQLSELTEDDKAILRVLHHNPRLTQKEIALELNWTVDRVKYYLNKMKKKTMIKRIGSRHNGYWKLLIEVRP